MLVGKLRCITGEANEFFIELEDETYVPIEFENPDRAWDAPLNEMISIVVKNGVVPDVDNFFKPIYSGMFARTNLTDKHVAIFSRGREDSDTDALIRTAESRSEDVKDFWRRPAKGYWSIEAAGFAIPEGERDCNYFPRVYCIHEMKTAYAAIPDNQKPEWNPTYWHVLGPRVKNLCGQASLGGTAGVTYGCASDTTNHELGHNFGLHHARRRKSDGSIDEYGDGTSIMGNSPNRAGLNAVNMYDLGLYEQYEVRAITTNMQAVICPHELAREIRHDNEIVYNMVKSPVNNQTYFISNRKGKGGFGLYRNSTPGLIYIHLKDRDGGSTLEVSLEVGESSDAIPGVTVENLEFFNEVNLVEVKFKNDTSEVTKDEINRNPFPELLNGVELSEVHDGLWYDPDYNGEGFDLFVKNNKMSIFWYTFGDDSYGGPEWFLGSTILAEGVEDFDILTTKGGLFHDPTKATVIKEGTGQVYFFDEDRGVFTYNTETHGRGSINLTSLHKREDARDGAYFDPARTGEGLTIRFPDDGKRCTMIWYTYDYKSTILGPGTRTWFLVDGKLVGDEYVCDVYMTTSRFQKINLDDVKLSKRGEATLRFNDDGSMVFDSTVENYTVTLNLTRLA